MKKYRVQLLAFSLTSVAALAVANAADVYTGPGGFKDAPYLASWAGFYAGVNGGAGWSGGSDLFAISPVFNGLNPSGGAGGGQIGYNWQGALFGPSVMLGIEADLQGSGIEDKATSLGMGFKQSLDWFGTVRGRLGYASGSSLLYATAGFAFGGVDNEISSAGTTFKNSGTATGYTVGGGWEYKFNPAWSVKAEYQFINLGSNDPSSLGVNICTSGAGLTCHDDTFSTIRAGVNYHIRPAYEALK